MLSHRNFLGEGLQVAAWVRLTEHDTILAALPIFHGLGLGALVHAGLMHGAELVLVPQFTPETVARLIARKQTTLMAGVPTLYEALVEAPRSGAPTCRRYARPFCGADTLPSPVRQRFEELVRRSGGNVRLLEGYGLTEAVSAVIAMPFDEERAGSIGVPFPDMLAGIFVPGTGEARRQGRRERSASPAPP